MPVELRERIALLSGSVGIDDLDPLVAWLRSTPSPKVSLRDCRHLHAGAVQALLVFRAQVTTRPGDEFLARHLMPQLSGSRRTKSNGEPR